MEFRDRLRALMEQHGYNNASLARAAGVNLTYVRDLLLVRPDGTPKIESPRWDSLEKIANVLGTTPEYLMAGRNPAPPDPEAAEVLNFMRHMSKPARSLVRSQAAEIAKRFPADEG